MEASQRTRLLSILLLALVFGTGVVVGVALNRTVEASPPAAEIATADEADPDGAERDDDEDDEDDGRRERRRPMYERVGELSESQTRRIDSIVQHHRESMRTLQEEFEAAYDPRYWAIIDSTRSAIMSVMTPAQAERYDSLLTAWDERRKERERKREESSDTTGR